MGRQLTVFLPVQGDPKVLGAALLASPDRWLPHGAIPRGPELWEMPLHGAGMTRTVACTIGAPWQTGEGSWRSLRWEALPAEGDVVPVERMLPGFTGEIGVAQVNGGPASLVLVGTYDPPGKGVGQLADVVLGRIARQTATALLVDISSAITTDLPAPAPA